jgi:2,3-bisphosphoglycerate-independent phosphoglycerate mutase
MQRDRPHFILLFLDGVGLGAHTLANPLAMAAHTPFLARLCGQPLTAGISVCQPRLLVKPIDACLGVPGLPQSATGQTTLYTGHNAAQFRGQHQTGFANGSLRSLIEAHGILKQVIALGGTATLANLYSPAYFEAIAQRRLRYAVGTLLNLTAGLPFRMQMDYEAGEAIFWDITGDLAHKRGIAAPPISPDIAGERLARLGSRYTFTLFECFLPDYAGHGQQWQMAVDVLHRVDRFVEKVVENLAPHVTMLITSDHGNLEDLSTKRHTLNPVPLIAVGNLAPAFHGVSDLTEIVPSVSNFVKSAHYRDVLCAKTDRIDSGSSLRQADDNESLPSACT